MISSREDLKDLYIAQCKKCGRDSLSIIKEGQKEFLSGRIDNELREVLKNKKIDYICNKCASRFSTKNIDKSSIIYNANADELYYIGNIYHDVWLKEKFPQSKYNIYFVEEMRDGVSPVISYESESEPERFLGPINRDIELYTLSADFMNIDEFANRFPEQGQKLIKQRKDSVLLLEELVGPFKDMKERIIRTYLDNGVISRKTAVVADPLSTTKKIIIRPKNVKEAFVKTAIDYLQVGHGDHAGNSYLWWFKNGIKVIPVHHKGFDRSHPEYMMNWKEKPKTVGRIDPANRVISIASWTTGAPLVRNEVLAVYKRFSREYPDYDMYVFTYMRNGIPVEKYLNQDQNQFVKDISKRASEYEKIKYPRTYHLPWSPGTTSDDKILTTTSQFDGKEVIVTEKMDGENCTIGSDYTHARSIDSQHHSSRSWVKGLQAQIGHEIPNGWRLCGENLYAKHSIYYEDLSSYFMLFSVWDENNVCLSWDETIEVAGMLKINVVPVLYRGLWDEEKIKDTFEKYFKSRKETEGYVVRTANRFGYGEFDKNVGKFVRAGHVQTDKHWKEQNVVPNKLKPEKNAGMNISKRAKTEYEKKRDFEKTPEPEAKERLKTNKRRFVIQRHDADKAKLHFDLRLEKEGELWSWAIPKHKLPKGKEKLLAVRTENHPAEYLKFEGEIPEGYGAGTVSIEDKGTYKPIKEKSTQIIFKLNGKKYKGTYNLFKTDKNWMIMEHNKKEAFLSKCLASINKI